MDKAKHRTGQRLSLKGQLCTVRYIGPVADKPGTWLGVEWDDPERGKHDGTHNGVKYFECKSVTATVIRNGGLELTIQAEILPRRLQHLF